MFRYKFDEKMTQQELESIIKNIEEAGLEVCGVICDMAGENRKLAKDLGITIDNTSFEHPSKDGRRVFWFFNWVHTNKNCRNHIIKPEGFVMPDGTIIGKADFERLFDVLEGQNKPSKRPRLDFSFAHKLDRHKHLEVKNQDKQKVDRACQLLSKTTHDAIKAYFDESPENHSMHVLAEFVLKMDSWFDTCNSSKEESHKPLKCAFGVHFDAQKEALIECMAVVRDLRVGKHRERLPWQNGLLISTQSLLSLYEVLRQNPKTPFLLTR